MTREGVMGAEYNKWSCAHHAQAQRHARLHANAGRTDGLHARRLRRTSPASSSTPRNRPDGDGHARARRPRCTSVFESASRWSPTPGRYRTEGDRIPQSRSRHLGRDPRRERNPGEVHHHRAAHGNQWFLGSITGWDARELETPLSFLGKGNWNAEIYADGPNAAKEPKETLLEKRVVTPATVLKCRAGAGRRLRSPVHSGPVETWAGPRACPTRLTEEKRL